MLLLPLWPKETIKFPSFAAVLVGANVVFFLVSWPIQLHQASNVGHDDLQRAAQKLAGIMLDADSGVKDTDRALLKDELAAEPFPSPGLVEFFRQTQADASSLHSNARYEWDLVYPLFDSYLRSVQKNPDGTTVFKRWGFNPERAWWPGIITHQFLHDGWIHLLFNMLFLWIAASIAEAIMGAHVFWLYLTGGIAAAFTQVHFGIPSGGFLLGASGPISALMGFCLVADPRTKVKLFYLVFLSLVPRFGVFDSPLWFFLAIWLLSQILLALTGAHGGDVSVAYAAHMGGFVFGCLIGLIWRTFNDNATSEKRS